MLRTAWLSRAVPLVLAIGIALPSIAAAQGIEEPRVPLRTALSELATLRTEYVEAFNKKDGAAVAAMYDSDATLIMDDGTLLKGDGIRAGMTEAAPNWPHAVIASDTVRVYGNTALDVGTWTVHPAAGGEQVFRYQTVSRRGMSGWKIVAVSVTPVAPAP